MKIVVLCDLTSWSQVEICRRFVPPLLWWKNVELSLFGKDNEITCFFVSKIGKFYRILRLGKR